MAHQRLSTISGLFPMRSITRSRGTICSIAAIVAGFVLVLGAPDDSWCQPPGFRPTPEQLKLRIAESRKTLLERAKLGESDESRATTVEALIAIAEEELKPGGNFELLERALRGLQNYPDSVRGVNFLIRTIGCRVPARDRPGNRLDGYPAATALISIGLPARDRLLTSGRDLPDHELHLRGLVLAKLERTTYDDLQSGQAIAVFRLMRAIEHEDAEPVAEELHERKLTRLKNLRRMVALLSDPGFLWDKIPVPSAAEQPKSE